MTEAWSIEQTDQIKVNDNALIRVLTDGTYHWVVSTSSGSVLKDGVVRSVDEARNMIRAIQEEGSMPQQNPTEPSATGGRHYTEDERERIYATPEFKLWYKKRKQQGGKFPTGHSLLHAFMTDVGKSASHRSRGDWKERTWVSDRMGADTPSRRAGLIRVAGGRGRGRPPKRGNPGEDPFFEVYVGNIGRVYTGTDREEAETTFREYSRSDEEVTLFEDGEILREKSDFPSLLFSNENPLPVAGMIAGQVLSDPKAMQAIGQAVPAVGQTAQGLMGAYGQMPGQMMTGVGQGVGAYGQGLGQGMTGLAEGIKAMKGLKNPPEETQEQEQSGAKENPPTMFKSPKSKKYANIVSIKSLTSAKRALDKLSAEWKKAQTRSKKRNLIWVANLASNRLKAMIRRRKHPLRARTRTQKLAIANLYRDWVNTHVLPASNPPEPDPLAVWNWIEEETGGTPTPRQEPEQMEVPIVNPPKDGPEEKSVEEDVPETEETPAEPPVEEPPSEPEQEAPAIPAECAHDDLEYVGLGRATNPHGSVNKIYRCRGCNRTFIRK